MGDVRCVRAFGARGCYLRRCRSTRRRITGLRAPSRDTMRGGSFWAAKKLRNIRRDSCTVGVACFYGLTYSENSVILQPMRSV